jgi:simple sugar transport system permease protein
VSTQASTPAAARARTTGRALRRLAANLDIGGLLVALAVLVVVLAVAAPEFLTSENVFNILRQAAFIGLVAFGMTLVIVAAEIDISVGSAAAFSSALLGVLSTKAGLPLGLAVPLVILEGALVGLAAGFIRAQFGVPSFIVTLALYLALKGLALLITDAFPITIDSPSFQRLGAGSLAGVPIPVLFLAVVFVAVLFVSTRTTFGRSVYAVGGNAEAARLSGISVKRVRIVVFGLTGALAALTGVLLSARLGTGNANLGSGLEFDAIAAVIIGGASLFGGRGTLVGTLLGVLFITVLTNGMVLIGVNSFAQDVVRGAVVLAAVLLSTIRRPETS